MLTALTLTVTLTLTIPLVLTLSLSLSLTLPPTVILLSQFPFGPEHLAIVVLALGVVC